MLGFILLHLMWFGSALWGRGLSPPYLLLTAHARSGRTMPLGMGGVERWISPVTFCFMSCGTVLNSRNGPSTGASSLSGSTKKLQIPLTPLCWVTSNLTVATISAVLKLFMPNKIFRCLTPYPGICQKLEQDNEQLKQNVSWLFFWANGLKAGNIAVWVSCIDTVGMDFYRGSNI